MYKDVRKISGICCFSDANVWGRATLDVRVCASPGRDKTVDERKVRQKRGVVSEEEPVRGAGRRGRKRGQS